MLVHITFTCTIHVVISRRYLGFTLIQHSN